MTDVTPTLPPSPAAQAFFGVPGSLLQVLMLAGALGVFTFIMWKRIRLLLQAAPDPRLDRIGSRLLRTLVFGLGQARQPRYKIAGTLHILIFFGFLVLSLRSLTLIGEGISTGFTLPGLGGGAGEVYARVKDWTALVVFASAVIAIVRRLVFRPARYHDRHSRPHGGEAYVILGLICLLMVADAVYEGTGIVAKGGGGIGLPAASLAALALAGSPPRSLEAIGLAGFWVHNTSLLFFLCYLPLSKHFHVITAIPNVFFLNLAPGGSVKPPRHGAEGSAGIEAPGVGRLEEFTWKHILDFYSCTDCGRCSDHCPAYATGTPLSPRMISIRCRDLAYESHPVVRLPGRGTDPTRALVGDIVSEDELWACTTCGACEEACPVLIEYVDKIVDMRRLLIEEGRVPAGLSKPLAAIEKHGNPYGKPARGRGAWLEGTVPDGGIRILREGESTDLLYFADSCTAYDPRIRQIAGALSAIAGAAGLDCGTMGADEKDSGHEARRVGEEGLFEMLREQNLEALGARSFRKVVTGDPHAYNALLNDYDLGKPVIHHTQLLAGLVSEGRIVPAPLPDGRIAAFHDPCYLGRHNGVFEAPRSVLRAIPGLRLVEMERTRSRSFCCGGGSLYLFYEGRCETRMGVKRLEMAEKAGADLIVTACPFCLINFEDAIKTGGREGSVEVMDIAELLATSAGIRQHGRQAPGAEAS